MMKVKVSQELQDRLRRILRQHVKERQVDSGKRCRFLNRRYYRNLIGIDLQKRFPEIDDIFDGFQAEINQIIESEKPSVEEAEAWLVERYNDSSLHNIYNKVSRRPCWDHFDITHLPLIGTALPEIAALLRRWTKKFVPRVIATTHRCSGLMLLRLARPASCRERLDDSVKI
jgi:hypothetical protein